MSNCQIEGARAVSMRIRAALGCDEVPKPDAAENVSRARLLRAHAGLTHVLTEIMPGITESAVRDELCAWLFEIHSITGVEECQARAEAGK
ncbi:transcriptional regulator [Enterobacter sp. JBIWA003]|uniref:transcriptional regulator n=1 Tax=Enterobacter sp. JBIWA003 TaxID=2831890 RepID=UPI001CBBD16B|nr:transcriptional regulator [Enterobacter sp. JBIWA003]UAN20961.1 transcriptional regulator [Enterobacter sp. JBIWA003]